MALKWKELSRQRTSWYIDKLGLQKISVEMDYGVFAPLAPLGACILENRKLTPASPASPIMNARPHRSLSAAPRPAFYFPIESGSPL
jgi:hypothetical protein